MTKRVKITLLLTSVILIIVAASTAGVSFAVWTSSGGSGGGGNSVTPSVIAEKQFVWAKYFNYDVFTESEASGSNPATYGVSLTTFYVSNAGINLGDVYIPEFFWVEIDGVRTACNTRIITNQVFMDATMKKLPVTIYIPVTVTQINVGAFINLPNLQKIVFLGTSAEAPCHIDDYAFGACPNLVSVEGARRLSYQTSREASFVGCTFATGAFQPTTA